MSKPLLFIQNLSAGYRNVPVLESLDLSLKSGEKVALIGPNGCGKSTLLRAIAGMALVSKGSVEFQDTAINPLYTEKRIHLGIGYLMQTRNIFAGLTVRENMEIAIAGDGVDFKKRQKMLLDHLPILAAKQNERAGLLSGGERQALGLAMVLARRVELLLLDEPIAGLSQKAATEILSAVSALQSEEGFAMLIVEHRLKLIQPWVNRAVVMVRGQIAEDTSETSILTDRARLETHYLL